MCRKKHGLCPLFWASVVGLGPYLPWIRGGGTAVSCRESMNLSGAPTQAVCWPEVGCSSLSFQNMNLRKPPLMLRNVRHNSQMLSVYKHKPQIYGLCCLWTSFFFLDKKKPELLKPGMKFLISPSLWEATRSEKWRVFKLEGVLDIWIDTKHKHSSVGCICSFWTFWNLCYLRFFVSLWEHKDKIPCGHFSIIYQREKLVSEPS